MKPKKRVMMRWVSDGCIEALSDPAIFQQLYMDRGRNEFLRPVRVRVTVEEIKEGK